MIVLPTERQQLLDQFTGFFSRRNNLPDMAMRLALSRNRWKRQLAETEYGRETIIQLVSNPSGKGADRFHPGCLTPAGRDVLTIGHIDDHPKGTDRFPRGTIALKRCQRTNTEVPGHAVWSDEAVLDLMQAVACPSVGLLDRRHHPVTIIGVNEIKVALP